MLRGSLLSFCMCQEARSHKVTAAACSQDDQCKGNLICFKRGPNDSVPGCIGHDPTGTCLQSQPLFLHTVVSFQVAHACTFFHHIQALTIASGQIRLRRCFSSRISILCEEVACRSTSKASLAFSGSYSTVPSL
jgi:hypothetical protein